MLVLGIIVRYHNNLHKMANHHTNEPNVEHINSVMLDEDMYNDFQKTIEMLNVIILKWHNLKWHNAKWHDIELSWQILIKCQIADLQNNEIFTFRAVVKGQLAEWSILTPEDTGLTPVITDNRWNDKNTEKDTKKRFELRICGVESDQSTNWATTTTTTTASALCMYGTASFLVPPPTFPPLTFPSSPDKNHFPNDFSPFK